MTRREYKANAEGSGSGEPIDQRAKCLMERHIVSECAKLGCCCFAVGLVRHRDRERRGPERIVDADLVGAQAQVKSVIAPYKYPRIVEFVDALPRTATGKVQRFRLRQSQ